MRWVYGVTTVPMRLKTTLPQTLRSLAAAGFDKPRLFIDGAETNEAYKYLGLEATCRYPVIRTAFNWILSLYELYLREPDAERFAIFQDDLVMSKNAREYLDSLSYGKHSIAPYYWNLYTASNNDPGRPDRQFGFYESRQGGKGALALVFSRDAVIKLLSSEYMAIRPQDLNKGWSSVDGAVVVSMANVQYKEMIHYPSLVQHTGEVSSMGHGKYPPCLNFMGEDFDCLKMMVQSETQLPTLLHESVSIVNV